MTTFELSRKHRKQKNVLREIYGFTEVTGEGQLVVSEFPLESPP
jgi:hypothetical protein